MAKRLSHGCTFQPEEKKEERGERGASPKERAKALVANWTNNFFGGEGRIERERGKRDREREKGREAREGSSNREDAR